MHEAVLILFVQMLPWCWGWFFSVVNTRSQNNSLLNSGLVHLIFHLCARSTTAWFDSPAHFQNVMIHDCCQNIHLSVRTATRYHAKPRKRPTHFHCVLKLANKHVLLSYTFKIKVGIGIGSAQYNHLWFHPPNQSIYLNQTYLRS